MFTLTVFFAFTLGFAVSINQISWLTQDMPPNKYFLIVCIIIVRTAWAWCNKPSLCKKWMQLLACCGVLCIQRIHLFLRGWEQLEVTCNPSQHHSNNLWNIEGHENERGKNSLEIISVFPGIWYYLVFSLFTVPKANPSLYKPSFFESVFESHVVMAQVSNTQCIHDALKVLQNRRVTLFKDQLWF